tara:strand:+ start:566 stop:715 length:150 start_codon:yes stop_codon:yes gene_type:complete
MTTSLELSEDTIQLVIIGVLLIAIVVIIMKRSGGGCNLFNNRERFIISG